MHSDPSTPKPRNFESDNCSGICPEAWEALERANRDHVYSYGADSYTERASGLIREIFERDCEVFFVFTGTASNALSAAALCNSYNAIICHQSAHITTDECSAPEYFTGGSKVVALPGRNAKLEPAAVIRSVSGRRDVHAPKVSALSLTQATEAGTVYQSIEVAALCAIARERKLKVHMDGARFANAVATLGCRPKEISWQAGVDVMCLGGTKNGLSMGEAVVFFDSESAAEFAYRRKQAGQLASKMRFISAQWVGLLENNAWLKNAHRSNSRARQLEEGLRGIAHLEILFQVEANSVFVRFPDGLATDLRAKGWKFHDMLRVGGSRLMCGWDTTKDDVKQFVTDVRELTMEPTA